MATLLWADLEIITLVSKASVRIVHDRGITAEESINPQYTNQWPFF